MAEPGSAQPGTNERVTGPIGGYFVATYACPTGSGREEFAPYFKLFPARPESYFQQEGCLVKSRPPMLTNDVLRALHLAQASAEELIAHLPAPGALQASRLQSLVDALQRRRAESAPAPLAGPA